MSSSSPSFSLPPFLSLFFPIRDAVLAPSLDGRPLRLEDESRDRFFDVNSAFIQGGAHSCKTSFWWQAATTLVSQGKSVLCLCRAVDRKPIAVQGMPLHSAFSARRIKVVYVKSREEFVTCLTDLLERTKAASVPDAILVDDLQSLSGLGDAEPEPDIQLARLFAVLKQVLDYVRKIKAGETTTTATTTKTTTTRTSTTSAIVEENATTTINEELSPTTPQPPPGVTLLVFSTPLQSRGVSLDPTVRAFFDLVFDLKPLEPERKVVEIDGIGTNDVDDKNGNGWATSFALTPDGRGFQPPYRIIYRFDKGVVHFDKLQMKAV